ncbi:MAG: PaaI family thioesterase [Dehalococcoidia bacterium]
MSVEEPIDASGLERRSRTVSWVPPAAARAFTQSLRASGVPTATLRAAMLRGELPPMPAWDYVGVRPVEAGEGRAICELDPGEYLANGPGSVQGGVLCTLIDAAITLALGPAVRPPGTTEVTLELKVNFVRPVPIGAGAIRCEAEVEHAGRQTAVSRARVVDGSGKLFATAVATTLFVATGEQLERVARQTAEPTTDQ